MTVMNKVLARQAKTKKITGPRYGWKLAKDQLELKCGSDKRNILLISKPVESRPNQIFTIYSAISQTP